MAESKANDFLEKESLGKLMVKYCVPCIIALLVATLYNIVDQLFIAKRPIWVPAALRPAQWCSR